MAQHSASPAVERRELGPDPDTDELVTTLLDAVGEAHPERSGPPETPLYETVESEALTALLGHADQEPALVVTTVVGDCDVALDSRGTVIARYRNGSTDGETAHTDLTSLLNTPT